MVVVLSPDFLQTNELIPPNGIVKINSENLDQYLAHKELLDQLANLWMRNAKFIRNQQEVTDIIESRIRQNMGTLYLRIKDGIPVSSLMIAPFVEIHKNKETGEKKETIHEDLPEACYLANDSSDKSSDFFEFKAFLCRIIENMEILFAWVDLGADNSQTLIRVYKKFGFEECPDKNGSWEAANKLPLIRFKDLNPPESTKS